MKKLQCETCGGPLRSLPNEWLKPGQTLLECVAGCWACDYCGLMHKASESCHDWNKEERQDKYKRRFYDLQNTLADRQARRANRRRVPYKVQVIRCRLIGSEEIPF